MKLHLIGGFLGSGKTTAISNAAIQLKSKNVEAGVITNDQGNYLVDSNFIDVQDIPSGEVVGGCFCCNYNDLDSQIDILMQNSNPEVIFAESVGSCTDLIATVLKPMADLKENVEVVSFSVFVDSRLLLRFLEGEDIGFSDEVSYIFEKQLEEGSILIVNKVDLLSESELMKLKGLVFDNFPGRNVLFQNSLDEQSIGDWLRILGKKISFTKSNALDIDYEIYGKGEAELAWLDEEIEIIGNNAYAISIGLIENMYETLLEKKIGIGHLKFLLHSGGKSEKISFTATPNQGWKAQLENVDAEKVSLMVNARAQSTPENLREVVESIVQNSRKKNGVEINEYCVSAFKPGFPNPTYRYTNDM